METEVTAVASGVTGSKLSWLPAYRMNGAYFMIPASHMLTGKGPQRKIAADIASVGTNLGKAID